MPDAPAEPPSYPEHWEADVVLRDGSTMRIRPILPDDADALQRFHARQSPESVYLRFFAPLARLPERDLYRFTHVDHHDRVALVVLWQEEIVAVGRFDQVGGGDAEVAFNVADSAQGKGLGSVLLEHLAAAGRELGVRRFVADVLPQNTKMVRVFTDAGYEVSSRMEDGVLAVSFEIASTERSLAVLAEREQRTEALSMEALMRPQGVLLLCSGPEGEAFGRFLIRQLTAEDAADVAVVGLPGAPGAMSGLAEVPRGGADLALIAAPAQEVLDMIGPLADLGVRGAVIYTGDFTPATVPGRFSQRTLLREVRRHGLRVVGPRSYGLIVRARSDAGNTQEPAVGGAIEASLYPNPP